MLTPRSTAGRGRGSGEGDEAAASGASWQAVRDAPAAARGGTQQQQGAPAAHPHGQRCPPARPERSQPKRRSRVGAPTCVGQHDHSGAALLCGHTPKVVACVLQGALRGWRGVRARLLGAAFQGTHSEPGGSGGTQGRWPRQLAAPGRLAAHRRSAVRQRGAPAGPPLGMQPPPAMAAHLRGNVGPLLVAKPAAAAALTAAEQRGGVDIVF